MKKTILFLFLLVMAPLLITAQPALALPERFVKGTHYEELPGNKSEKPQVVEAFSIYCPGCYHWEQHVIGALQERLDKKGVEFRQVHAAFMGNYGRQISQALAVTQGTDKYKSVKMALFDAYQEGHKDWPNDAAFFATLEKAGLSKKEWTLGLNDPKVRQKISQWRTAEKTLKSVPSFTVNNKYVVKMNGIKSFDEFYSLVDFLLEKQPLAKEPNTQGKQEEL